MPESKTVKWYKVQLYGTPTITYLVAAGSYEAVKKSFGCLVERYKFSPLDYDGVKAFLTDLVHVVAVKVADGSGDVIFVKDDEVCVLRIIL